MADEYGSPERRRTKKDLKRKRQFRVYKRGGKYRTTDISETENKKENKK